MIAAIAFVLFVISGVSLIFTERWLEKVDYTVFSEEGVKWGHRSKVASHVAILSALAGAIILGFWQLLSVR